MIDFSRLIEVLINFISDLLFWIFLVIVGGISWLFNKIFLSKFKKVKIKRIDIRNVPKLVNGYQIPVFPETGEYKNYVENEFVIENFKEELIINDLVIDNIEVRSFDYEEIIIQNGFDPENQIVDFVILNNGNKCNTSVDYQIRYWYLNNVSNEKMIIQKFEKRVENLLGGDVKKLFSIDLTDNTILEHFSDDLSEFQQSIKLEIINKGTAETESEIVIPYISSSKGFFRNMGGGEGLIDRTLTPIIELRYPYDMRYFKFPINHKLSKGYDVLRFNILVDSPIKICYRVRILENEKELAHYNQNYFSIQFPKYKSVTSANGNMYYYLRKNRLEMSDYEEVKLREPLLINTVDGIKKEFNL